MMKLFDDDLLKILDFSESTQEIIVDKVPLSATVDFEPNSSRQDGILSTLATIYARKEDLPNLERDTEILVRGVKFRFVKILETYEYAVEFEAVRWKA